MEKLTTVWECLHLVKTSEEFNGWSLLEPPRAPARYSMSTKKVFQFNPPQKISIMVEASDHGYVLHTRRIYVTLYRIRIQHQWRLPILNQFSVLIYTVCHILPSLSRMRCTSMGVWGSMIY
jgi:hypothetical protein